MISKTKFFFALCLLLQLSGQPAGAIEHTPQVVHAWNAACQQERDGNYSTAIDGFTWILKLFPETYSGDNLQYGAHMQRAEGYTALSQFAKAVDDYNWCLRSRPKDEAAIFCRGETFENWGKWREAERDFAQSVLIKPHDTDNRIRHAHALVKLKDYAGAVREYDAILKRTPLDDDVWRRRADALLLQGNAKAAVDSYSKAIGYDSDVGWYFHYRALAYEKLGQPDLAEKDRRKAQELNFQEKAGDLERY